MSIIDTLITDRTQADVTKLKSLLSKPRAMWTNEEWSDFILAKNKGAYNATDLNRVQEAMEYLAERFRGYGYNVPEIKRPSITEIIPGTSRLPEGYTELEYIRSTGEQYVNTEVPATDNIKIQAKLNMQEVTGYTVIGYYNSDSDEWRLFNYSNKFYFDYGNGTANRLYGGSWLLNTDYELEIGNHYVKNLLNGETIISGTAKTAIYSGQGICVFGNNNFSKGKLYYLKIYDNGTLVRDYVPCLNPSKEVGLYDIVNGEFYGNAGAGVFVAGDELGSSDGNIPTQIIERDYWKIGDIPRKAQMDTYLSNLGIIRGINEVMKSTPEIPGDMEGLLHTEANDIEQILFDVDYLLSVMVLNWFYTAEVFCGEV